MRQCVQQRRLHNCAACSAISVLCTGSVVMHFWHLATNIGNLWLLLSNNSRAQRDSNRVYRR